ncbi:flagellar hook-length control protein FliK, partial [Sphingomonas sp. CCH9-F2]
APRLARTPSPVAGPATPAAAPRATGEAPPAIDTAARAFADAIHRAVTGEDRPAAPDAPLPAPAFTAPVAAAGAAAQTGQQTLDMNQPRWPEAMIQRIEMLRDMADANDMSIRLVPDALGAIDISLRRDGDTVQVQLTAEQPRTRALLAEAQPQLTDMAEARGLKLQQTPAATGSDRTAMAGQQQQQSQAHQQAHQQSGQHQP